MATMSCCCYFSIYSRIYLLLSREPLFSAYFLVSFHFIPLHLIFFSFQLYRGHSRCKSTRVYALNNSTDPLCATHSPGCCASRYQLLSLWRVRERGNNKESCLSTQVKVDCLIIICYHAGPLLGDMHPLPISTCHEIPRTMSSSRVVQPDGPPSF
ncbi:hypothetical protein F4677DRAFT_393494 [Hypoxylon crocopeplum]|nr:hypothetical protein F4677DRAFT_393494 [Hypoxylon crocopeplum]